MAENELQERQFAYISNASKVLDPERQKIRSEHPDAGKTLSLRGRWDGKMGDRSSAVSQENEELREKARKRRVDAEQGDARSQTKKIKTENFVNLKHRKNVLDVAEKINLHAYNPRTASSQVAYSQLLGFIAIIFPNVSDAFLADVANELLIILNDNDHRSKRSRCEFILGTLSEAQFADLSDFALKLPDFKDWNIMRDEAEQSLSVPFDEDASDDGEETLLVEGAGDEDENEDENEANALHLKSGGGFSDGYENDSEKVLRAGDIDPFWLQRQISLFETDPHKALTLSEKVLECLMIKDWRSRETTLLELIGADHSHIITLLLHNYALVAYSIRYKHSQNEEEKRLVEQEMLADTANNGPAILSELKGIYVQNKRKDDFMHSQKQKSSDRTTGSDILEDEFIPMSYDAADLPKPTQVFDRTVFENENRSNTGLRCKLPPNSVRISNSGYEEIHVPPPAVKRVEGEKLVSVSEMPEWSRKAFENMKSLNRIQSKVYQHAMFTSENMLLCAPTGAGKTNVAMLSILHEMSLHRREDGSIDNDKYKVVYIAPMKALVKEMVEHFSKRLSPYKVRVRELSGDINLTKEEISETQIIVTTPEKWDIITRKSGDRTYTQLVRLVIIDEIHLLHDDRGPVLECIVSRTLRQIEQSQDHVRLVGLSATLPNYIDVADFLRVDRKRGVFFFDNSYRPVLLEQQFIGVTERSAFKARQIMNAVCYEKVEKRAGVHPILIFVHSRKETAITARELRDRAMKEDKLEKFIRSGSESTKELLIDAAQSAVDAELKELLPFGFAVHHAGLTRSDRDLVQGLFGDGSISVLVCTMTLAWGVNLPAHSVIIKGTQMYSPEQGEWIELSPQDVLQMLGRAGRPQFDTSGEGIIITNYSNLQYYLCLMNTQLPIESQLLSKLPDALNAEIVLGTIQNMNEAVQWAGYTYYYIRSLRNPSQYNISESESSMDKYLTQHRVNMIHSAASLLEKAGLVRYDQKTGLLQATALGKIASFYYLPHQSISTYNENMRINLSQIELFRLFAMSKEFSQIVVRQGERIEMEKLVQRVPVPLRESFDEPTAKVNILLQSYISRQQLIGFALACDMIFIQQSAGRIFRALYEIALVKKWSSVAQKCLVVCKMVAHRQWITESPLRQFKQFPSLSLATTKELIQRFESKPIAFDRYYLMDPEAIEDLIGPINVERGKRVGEIVYDLVHCIPHLNASIQYQPITRSILRIDITLESAFQFKRELHGPTLGFHIIIEDGDGENLLHNEYFVLKEKYVNEAHSLTCIVPLYEPLSPQYFVRIVSDTWMYGDTTIPIPFNKLILPSKFPAHTELLDLRPLAVSALRNPLLESSYSFSHFNSIQTQVFSTAYDSTKDLFVSAPSSSGKVVIAELCLYQLFKNNDISSKCIFITPNEQLAQLREVRWKEIFEKKLNVKVGRLVGDSAIDWNLMNENQIIITTPSSLDALTNTLPFTQSTFNHPILQQVRLIIAEKVHMIGYTNGAIYESLLTRLTFASRMNKMKYRMVGFASPLSDGFSLANWLCGPNSRKFCFHTSVRPVPLELHIRGFENNHAGARLLSMSKHIYLSIASTLTPVTTPGVGTDNNDAAKDAVKGVSVKNESGESVNQSIIIVASKRQCQLSAIDMMTFASNSNQPTRFCNIPAGEVDEIISRVEDNALKLLLAKGIAFWFEGMNESDSLIVTELYKMKYIRVCVVNYESIWSLTLFASHVIIADTCYYDSKDHGYVDYSIPEMLQMLSRASSHTDRCRALVFTHSPKKQFLIRFLNEPLPIESHIHMSMEEVLMHSISSKCLSSFNEAVAYFGFSYFITRLANNPYYYGITGRTDTDVSEFVSNQVEETIDQLETAGFVEKVGELGLRSLNLGDISSHYYMRCATASVFSEQIVGKPGVEGILKVLCNAAEFDYTVVRQHELNTIRNFERHLPFACDPNAPLTARKVNVLLQLYMSRRECSMDMRKDSLQVLPVAVRLAYALVDIASTRGFLHCALDSIRLCQCLVQGVLPKQQLLQIPHFTEALAESFKTQGVTDIFEFINMDDEDLQKQLLAGLSEHQLSDINTFCEQYPGLSLGCTVEELQAGETVDPGDRVTVSVKVSFGEDEEGEPLEYNGNVISSQYPQAKKQKWWIVIGEPSTNTLYHIREFNMEKGVVQGAITRKIKFEAPKSAGKHSLVMYLRSDSYMGLDTYTAYESEFEITVNAAEMEMEE